MSLFCNVDQSENDLIMCIGQNQQRFNIVFDFFFALIFAFWLLV